MRDITAIRYKWGNEVILFSKMEMEADSIVKKVHRIVWDEEFERLQTMPLKEVKEVIKNILDNWGMFED